jgi:hypothetical protein
MNEAQDDLTPLIAVQLSDSAIWRQIDSDEPNHKKLSSKLFPSPGSLDAHSLPSPRNGNNDQTLQNTRLRCEPRRNLMNVEVTFRHRSSPSPIARTLLCPCGCRMPSEVAAIRRCLCFGYDSVVAQGDLFIGQIGHRSSSKGSIRRLSRQTNNVSARMVDSKCCMECQPQELEPAS